MLSALARAFTDTMRPEMRRIIALCLGLTIVVFAVLWAVLLALLGNVSVFGSRYLNWLVDLLGAVAGLALTWLLFPAVCTLVFGFFLDRIAAQVEAMHYPGLGPTQRPSVGATLAAAMRLMSLTILLNLLALPVYLLVPLGNIVVFLALNGYLLGREYFEAVAFRRLAPILVRTVRRRRAGQVFLCGVVVAGIFAVPLLNLIAPVVAIALMVHVFVEALQNETSAHHLTSS